MKGNYFGYFLLTEEINVCFISIMHKYFIVGMKGCALKNTLPILIL